MKTKKESSMKTKLQYTSEIKDKLSYFDKVGIATRDKFEDLPPEHNPSKFLENFNSVIVYVEGHTENDDGMSGFSDYISSLSAQSDVINYLSENGYMSVVIESTNKDVSLVRMGIESGVGELSPVDSLLVRGLGLTATIGAIVTDSPLVSDEIAIGICISCDRCLKVCPIREKANAKGDLSKCGCGKCRFECPV